MAFQKCTCLRMCGILCTCCIVCMISFLACTFISFTLACLRQGGKMGNVDIKEPSIYRTTREN